VCADIQGCDGLFLNSFHVLSRRNGPTPLKLARCFPPSVLCLLFLPEELPFGSFRLRQRCQAALTPPAVFRHPAVVCAGATYFAMRFNITSLLKSFFSVAFDFPERPFSWSFRSFFFLLRTKLADSSIILHPHSEPVFFYGPSGLPIGLYFPTATFMSSWRVSVYFMIRSVLMDLHWTRFGCIILFFRSRGTASSQQVGRGCGRP